MSCSQKQAVITLLEKSGLKINCSKTEGMWIGSKRHYKEKPFGVKWPAEPIKAQVYILLTTKNCLKKRIL